MRRVLVLFLALMATVAFTGTAQAAKPTGPTSGVHFTQGGRPTCTVTLSGATATADCTAELAGLGQGDIVVTTTIQAQATYTCRNRGGNVAPGQNRVAGPVVGSNEPTVIPSDQIDNGRATVSDSAGPATVRSTVSGQEAGCPNGNWQGINPVVVGYVVTFTATQGGVTLFCRSGSTGASGGSVSLTSCGGVAT